MMLFAHLTHNEVPQIGLWFMAGLAVGVVLTVAVTRVLAGVTKSREKI